MPKRSVILLTIISLIIASSQDIEKSQSQTNTELRSFNTATHPWNEINKFEALGVLIDWTDDTSISEGDIDLDVAAFSVETPRYNQYLNYYYAKSDTSVSWDLEAEQGESGTVNTEILAGLQDVFIYYDKNDQNGFQFELGDDVWDCSVEGIDCIDSGGSIGVSEMSWLPMTVSEVDCPFAGSGKYSADCKVYVIEARDTQDILRVTFKLANQHLKYDDIDLGHDSAKIDIEIRYPWNSQTLLDPENAKVGISFFTAGKSETKGTSVSNEKVSFRSEKGTTAFSWVNHALVDNVETKVYSNTISGQEILDFECRLNCGLVEAIYIGVFQLVVGLYKGFKWDTQLLHFSWSETHPSVIVWDPEIGNLESTLSVDPVIAVVAVVAVVAISCIVGGVIWYKMKAQEKKALSQLQIN
eukprot:TRINITY_DN11543_c0_g1_i1.p1 TRINITY_DN11543_c0_g1~~TRINITY_DN11543_c0_g1_i1.p1  ORF type:complete len:413 (+),score=80.13 TRINITY_DN11543_c0_g1_i1:50-1288(+)